MTAAVVDVEALYLAHRRLLLWVAGRKFHVPEADCEALLHEALLSLLRTRDVIANPKAWLIAAVSNASRAYWRERIRTDAVEGTRIEAIVDTTDSLDADRIEREILVREVVSRMRATDREVLRLHYYEQLTAPEVAARLDTTTGYAEKLITKALKRARALYVWMSSSGVPAPAGLTQPAPLRLAGSSGDERRCGSFVPCPVVHILLPLELE